MLDYFSWVVVHLFGIYNFRILIFEHLKFVVETGLKMQNFVAFYVKIELQYKLFFLGFLDY